LEASGRKLKKQSKITSGIDQDLKQELKQQLLPQRQKTESVALEPLSSVASLDQLMKHMAVYTATRLQERPTESTEHGQIVDRLTLLFHREEQISTEHVAPTFYYAMTFA
jgi:hypothetical protein